MTTLTSDVFILATKKKIKFLSQKEAFQAQAYHSEVPTSPVARLRFNSKCLFSLRKNEAGFTSENYKMLAMQAYNTRRIELPLFAVFFQETPAAMDTNH